MRNAAAPDGGTSAIATDAADIPEGRMVDAGVDGVVSDVPVLVNDQQPTMGGWRAFVNWPGLDRGALVLCPSCEEVGDNETGDDPEELMDDSGDETSLVPSTVFVTARLAWTFPVRKYWPVAGRKWRR